MGDRLRNQMSLLRAVCGFIVLFLLYAHTCFADVNLKIVVLNPSETETRMVPVRYKLPHGIKKEDVLDAQSLSIDFDADAKVFYLHGEMELTPKESRTLKIVLKDIWKIPDEEISQMKELINNKVAGIVDENKRQKAGEISQGLIAQLDEFTKQQTDFAANVEKRMQLYPSMMAKMNSIKDEVVALERLAEIDTGESDENVNQTITLVIQIENPSEQELEIPVKYFLPKEVVPDYIINAAGFETAYDVQKEQFYLTKKEKFQPNEKKTYRVEVRNIWFISVKLINRYVQEAERLHEGLAGSPSEQLAKALLDEIKRLAQEIIESQGKSLPIQEHLATYADNKNKLHDIEENLERMRTLVVSSASKAPELSAQAKDIQKVFKQVEKATKMKLSKVAQDLVEKLKKVGVWRVAYTVVGFVIILTSFFYVVWFIQLKKEEKREMEKVVPKKEEDTELKL